MPPQSDQHPTSSPVALLASFQNEFSPVNPYEIPERVGPLPNRKHEQFCNHYLKTGSSPDSYVAAGYVANPSNAASLLRKQHIQERLSWLRWQASRRIEADSISTVEKRLIGLSDLKRRLDTVVEARAKAGEDDENKVPGASTGLLAIETKVIGSGKKAREIRVGTLDAALIQKRLDTEKQFAIESGQWSEKRELTGANGGPMLTVDLSQLTPDQLREVQRMAKEVRRVIAPAIEVKVLPTGE